MEPDRDPEMQRKARETFELFEAAVTMMRQNLRRRHPGADDEEIERRLGDWLHERPGAEHGDGWGHPVPWPRPRKKDSR